MGSPRYLVTGGDGFIGSHLVGRLACRGETTVVIQPGCEVLRLQAIRGDIRLCQLDVRDEGGVRQVIQDVRPTIIFHLAGAGLIPGKEPPGDVMAVNVCGAYNILTGMLAAETVETAVFVGSWYEYGSALASGSRRLPQPTSVYGVSKLAATLLVQSFALGMDVPAIVVRPFQVYGPSEQPHRLIPQAVRSARAGVPLHLHNPQSLRDWVYVEDVATALDVVGESECRGQVVDIGTGVTTSVADVVNQVFELMGVRREGGDGSVADRRVEGLGTADQGLSGAAETHVAKALFAWEATHDIKDGLRKTVAWYGEEGRR